MLLRPLTPADLPAVLVLNNDAQPATSGLDLDELATLVAGATLALAVEAPPPEDPAAPPQLAGFILVLGPGLDYASLNYRWFAARYDAFAYVDRVVMDPRWRRRGLGSAVYDEVARLAARAAPVLTCEVNLRPRNDGSLRFHDRLGFQAVGEQDTDGGAKRVVLLARPLAAEA